MLGGCQVNDRIFGLAFRDLEDLPETRKLLARKATDRWNGSRTVGAACFGLMPSLSHELARKQSQLFEIYASGQMFLFETRGEQHETFHGHRPRRDDR